MNCNYDMPVSECPAIATNTKQGEVDDKKDTQSVTTKDCMYYCIRNSIYKVDVNTKEKYFLNLMVMVKRIQLGFIACL